MKRDVSGSLDLEPSKVLSFQGSASSSLKQDNKNDYLMGSSTKQHSTNYLMLSTY